MNEINNPKIGIVVLNFNNFYDTKDCLESLVKITYKNYFVVVVDNNSNDFIFHKLKGMFPSLIFIRNKENLGYSGGNNVGINYCINNGADHILIINNDIVVTENFLEPMILSINKESVGIVGPKIYRFGDTKNVQIPLQKIKVWNKSMGSRWKIENTTNYPSKDFLVAKLAGSCFLLKRHMIEDVGLFDEKYFLYYADTDLQTRATLNNWKLCSIPASIVYHKCSKTIKNNILLQYYYDSRDFLFYVLRYNPLLIVWCLVYSLLNNLIRSILKHGDIPFLKKINAVILGVFHFFGNKRGIQNKTYNSLYKEPKNFRHWIPFYDPEIHKPVTQVSGLCFNNKGELLLLGSNHWNIPGGKPELGESVEETLIREVYEEANVVIKNYKPLGVMMIVYPGNPNLKEGEIFYQLRFISDIEKIDNQIPDPANGKIRKRLFVKPEKCIEYVKWGSEAKLMFENAQNLHNKSF